MTPRVRRLVFIAAAALLVAACSGGEEDGAAEVAVSARDTIIIDVRTPEEFAAGHLDGAELVDVKDASFDSKIAALDPTASYIVYCRSGNRSAQAAARMRDAGIADITDLGSLENASAETGIAIVTG